MNTTVLCAGTYVVDIITGVLDGPVAAQSGCHTSISSNPGGNALNVAVDLVNLKVAGNAITCAGAIGNDFEGQFLSSFLRSNGINNRTIVTENSSTAKSVILSFGNEARAFIVDKGASTGFMTSNLLERFNATGPSVFYIGESLASPDIDTHLPDILQHAKLSGATTVVDYIVYERIDTATLLRCAPYTDILHLNDYEARSITGTCTITEAAIYMRKRGFRMVAISEGEKGFVFSWNDRLLTFPAFTVPCIDATGAGDAFCSGLLRSIVKTGALPENDEQVISMARFASSCGACAVTEVGCTKGVSLQKAEALMTTQKIVPAETIVTIA